MYFYTHNQLVPYWDNLRNFTDENSQLFYIDRVKNNYYNMWEYTLFSGVYFYTGRADSLSLEDLINYIDPSKNKAPSRFVKFPCSDVNKTSAKNICEAVNKRQSASNKVIYKFNKNFLDMN